MDGDETSAQATSLQALLALQDADVHLDQLRHRRARLDERSRLEDLDAELARRAGVIAGIEKERAALKAREDELEREVAAVRERQGAIDRRLSSSEAGSFRDQEAMATELGSLAERAADLEDVELEVLEHLEPLERELTVLAAEVEAITRARGGLAEELRAKEAVVDAEIAAAVDARAALKIEVPDALALEYERLRTRLDGVGAARLEHGACSGCHLTVPATDLDRMRHAPAGTLFHCEQCGRILVAA